MFVVPDDVFPFFCDVTRQQDAARTKYRGVHRFDLSRCRRRRGYRVLVNHRKEPTPGRHASSIHEGLQAPIHSRTRDARTLVNVSGTCAWVSLHVVYDGLIVRAQGLTLSGLLHFDLVL